MRPRRQKSAVMEPPPGLPVHPDPTRASTRLVGRVGGHTLIYALAAATSAFTGLATVVVVTRYLTPAAFGRLAVLMVTQSLLMLVYNAGSLQGTFALVFGATGGDDDSGDGDDDSGAPVAHDRRRALATGFALTATAGAAGTLVVWVISRPAADLVLGDPNAGHLLLLAAAGAALAAPWRLASNALRLERRPWSYLVTAATQHLLGLALAIPLLVTGRGIGGVLGAIAFGNLAALSLAMWLIRHSLRPAASWADAKEIVRRGRALLPIVVSTHVTQLADVLILSHFVPVSQVGLYRIANRIGALATYWTSSFHMAWGSLRRDPVHLAAEAQHGRERVVAVVSTYFVLLTAGVVLAATVLSDILVRLAAPGYTHASSLIPLTAAGFALHGVYILSYRTADFPARRRWFVGVTMLCAASFAGAALVLIPSAGPAGAASAVIVGWTVGSVIMVVKGQRGPRPVPFQWKRMTAGILAAAVCAAIDRSTSRGGSAGALEVGLPILFAYPVLLVALRIVPASHIRGLAVALRWRGRPLRVAAPLPTEERAIVDLLLRQRADAKEVARVTGVREPDLHRRLAEALRTAAGLPRTQKWDAALGRHVLLDGSFAEREASARALYASGADPLEVSELVAVAGRLKLSPGPDSSERPARRAPRTPRSAGDAPRAS